MRTLVIMTTAVVALALAPTVAGAQANPDASEGLKGPPNANGYDKDKANAPAAADEARPGSSGKLKGPPNANGMTRDDPGK